MNQPLLAMERLQAVLAVIRLHHPDAPLQRSTHHVDLLNVQLCQGVGGVDHVGAVDDTLEFLDFGDVLAQIEQALLDDQPFQQLQAFFAERIKQLVPRSFAELVGAGVFVGRVADQSLVHRDKARREGAEGVDVAGAALPEVSAVADADGEVAVVRHDPALALQVLGEVADNVVSLHIFLPAHTRADVQQGSNKHFLRLVELDVLVLALLTPRLVTGKHLSPHQLRILAFVDEDDVAWLNVEVVENQEDVVESVVIAVLGGIDVYFLVVKNDLAATLLVLACHDRSPEDGAEVDDCSAHYCSFSNPKTPTQSKERPCRALLCT